MICDGQRFKSSTASNDINLHIFLNSVEDITEICKKAELTSDNTRIVCSTKGNKDKLPKGFEIAATTDPVKRINFYTSTCFEGHDIYDENGQIIIVSNPWKRHTLLDISTTLIQICGRIRDSRYRNGIIQIYSETRYHNDVTLEEYEEASEMEIENTERWVK